MEAGYNDRRLRFPAMQLQLLLLCRRPRMPSSTACAQSQL